MTDVNEEIVANYFELNGYMVRRNLSYPLDNKYSPDSDIDLLIYNPKDPKDKAIVEIKGWHNQTFTLKSYFKDDSLYNFVKREALGEAEKFFGDKDFDRILVISELPKNPDKQNEIINYVKTRGVNKVLEFKPILEFIFKKIVENKNYRDSESLQTIRLMKIYKVNTPQE